MRKQLTDLENFAYQIMDVKRLEQQESVFFWDLNKRIVFSKFSQFEKAEIKFTAWNGIKLSKIRKPNQKNQTNYNFLPLAFVRKMKFEVIGFAC